MSEKLAIAQWEYMQLQVLDYLRKTDFYVKEFDKLGKQRWEMTGVLSEAYSISVFFFKRILLD